jgi:hypothetical protein
MVVHRKVIVIHEEVSVVISTTFLVCTYIGRRRINSVVAEAVGDYIITAALFRLVSAKAEIRRIDTSPAAPSDIFDGPGGESV